MDNSVDKQSSEKRFALLIDADNVSAKYIKPITDELSNYGTVTIKRIYGDWTLSLHAKWKDALLENSLTPIQQFGYTQGKNATDSAMIIDAMDILYANSVEGFCIVSSDSDFTRLASRLRESGRMVIGMGEKKTPVPFRRACDVFTTLELLLDDANGKRKGKDAAGSGPTIEEVEQAVVRIITDNQNNGKATGLGEVGSRLLKRFPDFDVRSYGTNLLSKLLGKFASVEIKKNGSDVAVELADDKEAKPKADDKEAREAKPKADEQAPEPEPAGDAAQDAPEAEERKSDEQAEGEGPKAEDGAGSSSSRRRKRRGGSRRKARAAADGETAASPEDGAEPAAEGEPAPDKKDGREPGAEGASATRTASGDDGTAPKPAEDGAASEPAVGGATPEPAEGQAASAPGGGQRPGAEEGAGPESSGAPAESTAAAESEAAKAPKTSKRRPRRKARAAEGAAEPMEPAVGTGNAEPKPQAKPEPKPEPQAKSKPEASGAEQAKSNPEPGQSGRRPQTEQPAAARREADATTRRLVAQAGPDGIAVSQLASLVRSKHRGFKVRDLGYAQFKAYVADLDDIEVSRIGKEWFARMAD